MYGRRLRSDAVITNYNGAIMEETFFVFLHFFQLLYACFRVYSYKDDAEAY